MGIEHSAPRGGARAARRDLLHHGDFDPWIATSEGLSIRLARNGARLCRSQRTNRGPGIVRERQQRLPGLKLRASF